MAMCQACDTGRLATSTMKTPTARGNAQVPNSRLVATASTVNFKSVLVDVTTSETQRTYAAEDLFELEMPTQTLSLDKANDWLAMIAETEGVDSPLVIKSSMSKNYDALALPADWCIAVRKSRATQLLLLHEMAHLLCVNKNHGTEFRTELIRLVRRYISFPHAAALHKTFANSNLKVISLSAT
jgi:hypothetical protein